jgi:HD-GYP domain-containing protein (c-di-GMP phosphodiesterase class II)
MILMMNYVSSARNTPKEISPDESVKLFVACLLHDIGKSDIRVKEVVLLDRVLTDEEYSRVKMHTDFGYDLLKQNDVLDPEILDIALFHGSRGDQLEGILSLVAIMDSFEAMTSLYRKYREPMSVKDALSSLMSDCNAKYYGNEGLYYFEGYENSLCELGIVKEYVLINENNTAYHY